MNRIFSDIECKKVLAFDSSIDNKNITKAILKNFKIKMI